MKRIETVHDFIRERYGLFGWCNEHGFRDIDLRVLVARGWGERSVRELRTRMTCAHCHRPLELIVRAPAPYAP